MGPWFSRRDFLPAGLKADRIELDRNRIRVHARSLDPSAACPHCGTVSRHVHSKYWRRPADLSHDAVRGPRTWDSVSTVQWARKSRG